MFLANVLQPALKPFVRRLVVQRRVSANLIRATHSLSNYPSAHWIRLRTNNAIESTSAAKVCTRNTKGAGSRDAGLTVAFKQPTQAESRWRRVNLLHLVALVAVGTKFPGGETRILSSLPADSVVNLQVDATLKPAIHSI